MPRLKDLLEYLATPGLEDIWILIDIKVPLPSLKEALIGDKNIQTKLDEQADDLLRSIAATLRDVDVKVSRCPWNQRVLVGCWAVSFPMTYPTYAHFLQALTLLLTCCRQDTSPSAQPTSPPTP